MSYLERAEAIGKEISEIAAKIDREYWVKSGRHISTDDFLPEIVAAVIYLEDRITKERQQNEIR